MIEGLHEYKQQRGTK